MHTLDWILKVNCKYEYIIRHSRIHFCFYIQLLHLNLTPLPSSDIGLDKRVRLICNIISYGYHESTELLDFDDDPEIMGSAVKLELRSVNSF